MNRSRISWLVNADGTPGYTWSPMSGCGPGLPCYERCWAKAYHVRYRGGDFGVKLHPEKLDEPLRLRKPSTIGVCLMGDLFHDDVPDEFILAAFGIMAAAERHTFIVLTKRPKRALSVLSGENLGRGELTRLEACWQALRSEVKHHPLGDAGPLHTEWAACPDGPWPLPNVWLGVSVEDQATADERIPILLDTPAAHRWVSLEPQLGPVDLPLGKYLGCLHGGACEVDGPDNDGSACDGCDEAYPGGLDLVVTGCEAGPGRRPFDHDWARLTRDQCEAAGVLWYYKQAPDRVSTSVIVEKPHLDGLQHLALPWGAP